MEFAFECVKNHAAACMWQHLLILYFTSPQKNKNKKKQKKKTKKKEHKTKRTNSAFTHLRKDMFTLERVCTKMNFLRLFIIYLIKYFRKKK